VKVGLDLLAFPTILYASIPKSTSDLRQSSRRSLRPGQTKPVKVLFLVYPTMEFRLLRLMARKMKASLMVEGKLPGEGLVSFGEEDAEDEHDLYVQLAREVLASLEAGTPDNLFEQAEALQAIFQENLTIEREKNQTIGQEGQAEPVVFDPIRVEPLATSAFFIDEMTPVVEGSAQVPPLSEEQTTPLSEVVNAHTVLGVAEPVMVTVIHTSITTGQDPWATLRAKHLKPRKSRKIVTAYPEGALDLWTVEIAPVHPVLETPQETPSWQGEGSLVQSALW